MPSAPLVAVAPAPEIVAPATGVRVPSPGAPVVRRYSTTVTVTLSPRDAWAGTPSRSSGNTVAAKLGGGETSTSISSSSPVATVSVQMPAPNL